MARRSASPKKQVKKSAGSTRQKRTLLKIVASHDTQESPPPPAGRQKSFRQARNPSLRQKQARRPSVQSTTTSQPPKRRVRKQATHVVQKRRVQKVSYPFGEQPSDATTTIITTPEQFVNALNLGVQAPVSPRLLGRVLRGTQPSDFLALSPDTARKLIMFTDASGLQQMLSSGGSLETILLLIGYPRADIQAYRSKGTLFKLLVVTQNDDLIFPATWLHLVTLIAIAWPAHPQLTSLVRQHLTSLQLHGGPAGYHQLMDTLSPQDRQTRWTVEALLTLDPLNVTAAHVRKFLHDTLNLNDLFMGDGFTYTVRAGQEGQAETLVRGVPEYFAPNMPLAVFHDAQLIDLNWM